MKGNRIELFGILCRPADQRSTPAGGFVMRTTVESGEGRERMRFEVLMLGEVAREIARQIQPGVGVRVVGSLRPVRSNRIGSSAQGGIEIVADEIDFSSADSRSAEGRC